MTEPEPELLTAEQVAALIGTVSSDSARRALSRMAVGAVRYQPHPESGRPQAVYSAAEVREALGRRPGQGARRDLPLADRAAGLLGQHRQGAPDGPLFPNAAGADRWRQSVSAAETGVSAEELAEHIAAMTPSQLAKYRPKRPAG